MEIMTAPPAPAVACGRGRVWLGGWRTRACWGPMGGATGKGAVLNGGEGEGDRTDKVLLSRTVTCLRVPRCPAVSACVCLGRAWTRTCSSRAGPTTRRASESSSACPSLPTRPTRHPLAIPCASPPPLHMAVHLLILKLSFSLPLAYLQSSSPTSRKRCRTGTRSRCR